MTTKFVASRGVDSNENNQAGAGDAIVSRSVDKLKTSPLLECLWRTQNTNS